MKHKKAAVFILLGQSNAVGHGIPMAPEHVIGEPMKNVFGLHRDSNQSFDTTSLTWSGYTSFGMNLAEEQDNTYSVANCLAALWQGHIDEGNRYGLPDLYIVHIAIGAQGVTQRYMWYPERERQLIPGKLGEVKISLFPFARHVLSLLDGSFAERGLDYEVIGLHWRGGENDVYAGREYLAEHLEAIYRRMLDEFCGLLGEVPIILHRIVCSDRMKEFDTTGECLRNMYYINGVFDALEKAYPNVSVLDARQSPQYVPEVRGNGLFIRDAIHYTPELNAWVAEEILKSYSGR